MNDPFLLPSRRHCWTALALHILCCDASAQALPAATEDSAQQYLEFIEQQQDASGMTAAELIEPLTALGQYYVEHEDYELAADSFERARTIMRVNEGFDTPRELSLLARQVAAVEASGNVVAAWELEQSLLQLAQRNLDSSEAVPVFVAAAAKRVDIWNRYRAGDHPPEIELGCYYDRSKYQRDMATILPAAEPLRQNLSRCGSGERGAVLIGLLVEARRYQMLGVEALLRNDAYTSDELLQLVTEVLRNSHAIWRRLLSAGDPALGDMMVRLLSHEPKDSAGRLRRAEFLLLLADVNIVRARQARRMNGLDTVRQQYEQVWLALQEEGVTQEVLAAKFAPALPMVLPAFAANPLALVSEADATGYIDVTFEITNRGTGRAVEVVGSNNVQRADIRALQQVLDLGSFRPRMQDGKVLEVAPVALRYYVRGDADDAD